MRRPFAVVAVLAVLVAAGCGEPTPEGSPAAPTTSTAPRPVGITDATTTTTATALERPAVLAVSEGIRARFESAGPLADEVIDGTVTFRFAPELSAGDRERVRTQVEVALRYWADRGLVPFTLWAGRDPAWMRTAYHEAFPNSDPAVVDRLYDTPQPGIAGPGAVVHQVTDEVIGEVIPHEVLHVLQAHWSGRPGDDLGPCWLVEGSAHFFGLVLGAAGGLEPDLDPRGFLNRPLAEAPPLLTHDDCDELTYELGAVAVELLQHRYGEDALVGFFTAHRPGVGWAAAFRLAFGVDPDEFAAAFAEHLVDLVG